MRMQVKLEIGHKAACRLEPTPEGFTHDWTVFVRGSEGKDISHFVEKVIFHLHESFPKPKRAIKDPPYKLDESGYGSFELKIEVCFKTKDEPRRVHFTYDLFLPLNGLPPVTSVRTEALTFTHPTEDFMKKLVKGGGVPISAVNGVSNGVSNGHPPAPQETKEPTQKIPPNISETEKPRKNKIPKSSSKPSSAIVGMKRSPPLHEQTSTDGMPRKKKKSSEGSSSSKTKHLQGENVVMPVSQPLTTEVKDLKVKFKPIPPKENVEKERKKDGAVEGHKPKTSQSSKNKESKSHKSEHESKKLDTGEHKIKVKKKGEKSEKKREKKEKSKSKKDKIEKVTIRRSSGDSWASAGLMSNVFAKNKALGKLLSEMSSDEDEGDLPTPFKHEPSPIQSKITSKDKSEPHIPFRNDPSPIPAKAPLKDMGDLPASFKRESSPVLPKTIHKEQTVHHKEQTAHHKEQTAHHKEQTVHHKEQSVHHKEQTAHHKEQTVHHKEQTAHHKEQTVHHKEQTAHHKEQTVHHKEQTTRKEHAINKNNINSLRSEENDGHIGNETTSHVQDNTEYQLHQAAESGENMKSSSAVENGMGKDEKIEDNKLSSKEIYNLYEQITQCEDTEFLQKVVDVIETTGLYTVAEKTFEFDLCRLDKKTLQKLQKCLGLR